VEPGGCSVGYARAGFDVVGVDLKPQKNYPFEFVQADALQYLADHGQEFDAIHASPPCQHYSAATRDVNRENHPDLVAECRELLERSGKPWVIENVMGAPLSGFSAVMCGSMFGMKVRRHRLFETSFLMLSPPCNHAAQPRGPVRHRDGVRRQTQGAQRDEAVRRGRGSRGDGR
jgi:DNA (cytosine-5)-methyltransferase 1